MKNLQKEKQALGDICIFVIDCSFSSFSIGMNTLLSAPIQTQMQQREVGVHACAFSFILPYS